MENYLPVLGAAFIALFSFLFGLSVGQNDRVGEILAPSIKEEDAPKPQPQTNQATAKPINTAPPQDELPRTWRRKELTDEDGTQVFSWEKV